MEEKAAFSMPYGKGDQNDSPPHMAKNCAFSVQCRLNSMKSEKGDSNLV